MPWDEVLHKYKHGSLRSGNKLSGPFVRKRSQAIAIMLSEKRKAKQGDEEYMPLSQSIGIEKEKVVAAKGTLFGKPKSKVIRHPGALKRAAKRAGQTTRQYADKHKRDSGTTGNRARLAETLMGMH